MAYEPAKNSKEFNGPAEIRYVDDSFYIKINGKRYDIWESIELEYARDNYASKASVTLPRYNLLVDGTKEYIFDEKAFIRSEAPAVEKGKKPLLEVYFSGEQMMTGVIDGMTWSLKGNDNEHVSLNARDFLGVLADERLEVGEHIANSTTGEVVKKYVEAALGKYGVKCVIGDPTPTKKVGAFANSNYRFIPANTSRLDVIAQMAMFEGRVFFMEGDTFYFIQPRTQDKFRTIDITYEKDTRDIDIRKNWASENLVVEGKTKPTKSADGKKLDDKAQMIVVRVGSGNFKVVVPYKDTMPYGQGRNREQARAILEGHLKTIYARMTERILSASINDIPGRIDLREFNFKVRLLNVGLGLSQYYLPLSVKHKLRKEGTYNIDLEVVNVPEGAEEAIQGGTFVEGEE